MGITNSHDESHPPKANANRNQPAFPELDPRGWQTCENCNGSFYFLKALMPYCSKCKDKMYPKRGKGPYLYVKTLKGKTITLCEILGSTSIQEVKQQLSEREGVPVAEIRLIFAGKGLEDSKTVADYNMQKDSTLHMVLRLKPSE